MRRTLKKLFGRKNGGFTLVELIITLGIFALIIGIIYGIFISSRRVQTAEEQLVGLAQEARGGLEMLVREARMAGGLTNAVMGAADCNPSTTELNLPGLITRLANDIEFEGDVDLDGTLERVRYFYDPAMKTLNRWELEIPNRSVINCSTPLANYTGAINKEVVAYNINALTITYYDAGNTALIQPITNAADITKMSITIQARGEAPPNPIKTLTVEVKFPNFGLKKTVADDTPPAPPTGVTAVNRRVCGYLGVTWNANSEKDLAGYRVYYKLRNIDGTWPTEWSGEATVGRVTSYEFAGLTNGATYQVQVRAYDTSGNISGFSNTSEAQRTVTLVDDIDPGLVNVTAISNDTDSTIRISWTQGSDRDVDGRIKNAVGDFYPVRYTLLRDTSPSGAFNTTVVELLSPITNVSWLDPNVNACTIYYYKVRSVDACGRTSLSNPYGADRTSKSSLTGTKIIVDTVGKPKEFYPGGGTVHTTAGGGKTWSYARFSGVQNTSDALVNSISITYNSGTSCPSAPTLVQQGNNPPAPGGTAITGAYFDPALTNVPAGGSFTGRWPNTPTQDGIYKGNSYRFAAFSKNKCGYWSEPFDPGYCVDKCQDSTVYTGGSGLGDSCVIDYLGDPIQVLACDRLKIYWRTKKDDGVSPPDNCTAYRRIGVNETYADFYPDQGDGGYLIHRAVDTDDVRQNGEVYHVLAPDPVTGPIQPFYYQDIFYDQGIPHVPATTIEDACQRVADNNETYYRDRCSYRYKIKAVDCALNQSAFEAVQLGVRSAPGVINAPSAEKYPVITQGVKKNKLVFTVQNTSVAKLTLRKMFINWIDPQARLIKVEMANSVESGGAFATMWQGASGIGVYNGATNRVEATVEFTSPKSIAASPIINPSNPTADDTTKAWIRLTFVTTSGAAQRMDDNNEELMIVPYWTNETSTYADKMCPPATEPAAVERVKFFIRPVPPPAIGSVYQNPPNLSGTIQGDPAITNAPIGGTLVAGLFRNPFDDSQPYPDRYFIINGPLGVNDPASPVIRVKVTPYSSSYPVAQCGDDTGLSGVLLYWTDTDFSITNAPLPNAGDDYLKPTNYSKIELCREDLASPCSTGTCTYSTKTAGNPSAGSIPALSGRRVWFYIAAIDSNGNYSITPIQSAEVFDTTYNYDTCGPVETFKYAAPFRSYDPGTKKVSISSGWTSRERTGTYCSNGSPDKYTVNSTVTVDIQGIDPATGSPASETLTTNTISGCSGCYTCESGFPSVLTSTKTYNLPITVDVRYNRCGFTEKRCAWKYDNVETIGDGIGNDDGICDAGESCYGTWTKTFGDAYCY